MRKSEPSIECGADCSHCPVADDAGAAPGAYSGARLAMVGILPIALGQGAGGDSRAPLGIAVVGGMFFSTGLTFVIVPAAYVVIERLRQRLLGGSVEPEPEPVAVAGGR